MAQNDGTLEAYCTANNHVNILVNIRDLAKEILNINEKEKSDDGGYEIEVIPNGGPGVTVEHQKKVQGKQAANPPTSKYGTPKDSDL
jgi:hypothetical protein